MEIARNYNEMGRYANRLFHDMKLPLQMIMYNVRNMEEMLPLRDEMELQFARGQLEGIFGDCHRAMRMISHAGDGLKLLNGTISPTLGGAGLRALLLDLTRLVRPYALRGGVTVAIELPDKEPPVAYDEAKLAIALLNLLSNAVRHAHYGGRIRLRLTAGKESAKLEVEDDGFGVAESVRSRLFEPFVTTRPDAPYCAGLGLYLSRGFVRLNGGELRFEPLRQGSRFCVELPFSSAPAPSPSPLPLDSSRELSNLVLIEMSDCLERKP